MLGIWYNLFLPHVTLDELSSDVFTQRGPVPTLEQVAIAAGWLFIMHPVTSTCIDNRKQHPSVFTAG